MFIKLLLIFGDVCQVLLNFGWIFKLLLIFGWCYLSCFDFLVEVCQVLLIFGWCFLNCFDFLAKVCQVVSYFWLMFVRLLYIFVCCLSSCFYSISSLCTLDMLHTLGLRGNRLTEISIKILLASSKYRKFLQNNAIPDLNIFPKIYFCQ